MCNGDIWWRIVASKRHLHLYGTFALALPEGPHGPENTLINSSRHAAPSHRHLCVFFDILVFFFAIESRHQSSPGPNTLRLRPSPSSRRWQKAPPSDFAAQQHPKLAEQGRKTRTIILLWVEYVGVPVHCGDCHDFSSFPPTAAATT
jgi:hypothetical protein